MRYTEKTANYVTKYILHVPHKSSEYYVSVSGFTLCSARVPVLTIITGFTVSPSSTASGSNVHTKGWWLVVLVKDRRTGISGGAWFKGLIWYNVV